ncbi:hypothetical protein ACOYW6_12865 [Parablastomonas sp. CN1-191]|uniref:hypothetical protein n=1 Tax=Parablastomonas sp. CN1-191 TaxID=3400908 RepID=UPI003BF7AE38
MWDFIWHLRGSAPLDGVGSNGVALERVEQLLARQGKSVSERGSDYLVFDDPLWREWFGPNWLAMVIYDRGRFWIEQDVRGRRLRYDLRSLHGLVFCLFAGVIAFFFGLGNGGLPGGLRYAAGAFAWLYGMNVMLALVRVPSGIRKAVKSG